MSNIIPAEAELKAAGEIIHWLMSADKLFLDTETLAVTIATHTRYEGKTAWEWHTAMEGECLAYTLAASRAEAAEAKVTELEAKLDAVEIDNIGHAHALSMLRGLFGLSLDGTMYDEIWDKHKELMEAAERKERP